ncbi:hypothetical protein ACFLRI_01265 [Bacteroidota bacterium]
MEEKRFELEGQIEETEEQLEEEEVRERGPLMYILLTVFIILFVTTASLFVYFQFYQGGGKWSFSLTKQPPDATSINQDLLMKIDNLKAELDSLKQSLPDTSIQIQEYSPLFTEDMQGEKFEVQIGYFKSYDFSLYLPYLVNMNVEKSKGSSKLLIGRFDNFQDACNFRRDMLDIGIQGAFVVKKVDGKRIPFDEKCP